LRAIAPSNYESHSTWTLLSTKHSDHDNQLVLTQHILLLPSRTHLAVAGDAGVVRVGELRPRLVHPAGEGAGLAPGRDVAHGTEVVAVGTTVADRLDRVVAEQRRTLHLPAVDLAVETLTGLALVRPLLPVHQDHVGQLLVLAGVPLVALRAAAVLAAPGEGAVAARLLALHHAAVAGAALARVLLGGEGQPVGHLGALEHAAQAAVRGPRGTLAPEAPVQVDALSRGVAGVQFVRAFVDI
jgi:hypothetical protein